MVRKLGHHTQIFLGKGGFLLAKHAECAEQMVAANKGDAANRLDASSRQITRGLRGKTLRVQTAQKQRLTGGEYLARHGAFQRN